MGLQQAASMLALRTSRQNRTKVPKPLCGTAVPRADGRSPVRTGIIRRFRVPVPVSDKKQRASLASGRRSCARTPVDHWDFVSWCVDTGRATRGGYFLADELAK